METPSSVIADTVASLVAQYWWVAAVGVGLGLLGWMFHHGMRILKTISAIRKDGYIG